MWGEEGAGVDKQSTKGWKEEKEQSEREGEKSSFPKKKRRKEINQHETLHQALELRVTNWDQYTTYYYYYNY